MSGLVLAACFVEQDPVRTARFWAAMLHRPVVEDARGCFVAGGAGEPGLVFTGGGPAIKRSPNHLHVHLASSDAAQQRQTVASALELGASHLDVGQRPDEEHIVLADPGGNAFCVIEPGNRWLAGCGFFAELACDGTRAVGAFWSEVLGWPLVWDQDGETAIQPPDGGSKVAWGGPPLSSQAAAEHQQLALVDAEPAAQLDRLVRLGASVLAARVDGSVLLADPDGFPFRVCSGPGAAATG